MILNTQIHNPSTSDVKRDSWTTTGVAAQKGVESHNEVQKVLKRESQRITSSKAMMLTVWPRRSRPQARNPRRQKARNLRLEHSTARSTLRGPRRVQVHVHDGRGVDGDGYDECENHVCAETESSESHWCEVTPIQKMARKVTEEQKVAELKKCRLSRNQSLDVQQTVHQYQAAEEARAIAAREAAVETSREEAAAREAKARQDHRRGREREWTNSQFSERRLQTACRRNSSSSKDN